MPKVISRSIASTSTDGEQQPVSPRPLIAHSKAHSVVRRGAQGALLHLRWYARERPASPV